MRIGERVVGPNLYEYVSNQPIKQLDPLGLISSSPETYICQGIDPDTGVPAFQASYCSHKSDNGQPSKCCDDAVAAYNAYVNMLSSFPGELLTAAAGAAAGPLGLEAIELMAYRLAQGDFYACMSENGF
jgi:hypothetical protein